VAAALNAVMRSSRGAAWEKVRRERKRRIDD
jgi:hypothetical protein